MDVSATTNWAQIEERMALNVHGNHHRSANHSNGHHLHGAMIAPNSGVPSTPTGTAAAATAAGGAHQQQITLKCPRCDSSNTKFCYYNNYSLSQPRHFCKACKRYWTRGGTLRNVPVGGGCRKNKRVKKSSSSSSTPSSGGGNGGSGSVDPPSLPHQISNLNLSLPRSSSSAMVDPIFYGFQNGGSADLNLPAGAGTGNFPSFLKRLEQRNLMSTNLASCTDHYDLGPQLGSLGLFYPAAAAGGGDYSSVQFSTTSPVNDYSLLGSSTTAASLLAATLRQQQTNGAAAWPASYDAMAAGSGLLKENIPIKNEEERNVVNNNGGRFLDWQVPSEILENTVADGTMPFYWNNANSPAIGGSNWMETAANSPLI